MDVELDILKKLPPDTNVDYGNDIELAGDSLRSFNDGKLPQEREFVDPLTLKRFGKPYVKEAYELEDLVADLFKKNADQNCYRCNGCGVQWRARGWVASRCKCVKVP